MIGFTSGIRHDVKDPTLIRALQIFAASNTSSLQIPLPQEITGESYNLVSFRILDQIRSAGMLLNQCTNASAQDFYVANSCPALLLCARTFVIALANALVARIAC